MRVIPKTINATDMANINAPDVVKSSLVNKAYSVTAIVAIVVIAAAIKINSAPFYEYYSFTAAQVIETKYAMAMVNRSSNI